MLGRAKYSDQLIWEDIYIVALLSLICNVCAVRHCSFKLPLGAIVRLFSVIVPLSGYHHLCCDKMLLRNNIEINSNLA